VCGRPIWRASLAAIGATFPALCACSSAAEYTIDSAHTVITFELRSLGTAQRGVFNGATGTVTLDSEAGSGRIDIVIDARSVEARGEAMEKFVRGPAMLNVGVHPEIAYRAERVIFVEGKPARIEGELTLLGVTRGVPLAVTRYDCTKQVFPPRQRCSMIATTSFRRSAFGMTRYLVIANDEVKLAIHAEGVRIPSDDAPPDPILSARSWQPMARVERSPQ
jgi:polyisoprenoid-binding protein YceI